MTRTEASHLADTVAHDLALLAPTATRVAILRKMGDNTYTVIARRGAETVMIAHPEAWTGDEAGWQRLKVEYEAALKHETRPPLKVIAGGLTIGIFLYVVMGWFVPSILWWLDVRGYLRIIESIGKVFFLLVYFKLWLWFWGVESPERKRPRRRP